MESDIQQVWGWVGREATAFGFRWLIVVGVAMIGTLLFGRNYKKRIAALEAQGRSGPTVLQVNVSGSGERVTTAAIQDALRAEGTATEQIIRMKEAVDGLEQVPFGDGHSYAELPAGTRVVTMPDGTIRLALPVRLRATLTTGAPTATAKVTVVDAEKSDD